MRTKFPISLIFFLQAVIYCLSFAIAQKPGAHQQSSKCSNKGNLKSDKLLKERDEAFDLLYRNLGHPDMYIGYEIGVKFSDIGEIWTTSFCPPNIKMEACRECVNNTIPYLKTNCPKQKEGVAWTSLPNLNCMVRYEDYRTQQTLIDWAWTTFSSTPNETRANAGELEKGLNNLAHALKDKVTGNSNIQRYVSGSMKYGPSSYTLYGSMQCTPDITEDDCMKCLSVATNAIHNCCSRGKKLSGISMSTNCYFWYAHHNFLPKTSPLISTPSLQP